MSHLLIVAIEKVAKYAAEHEGEPSEPQQYPPCGSEERKTPRETFRVCIAAEPALSRLWRLLRKAQPVAAFAPGRRPAEGEDKPSIITNQKVNHNESTEV